MSAAIQADRAGGVFRMRFSLHISSGVGWGSPSGGWQASAVSQIAPPVRSATERRNHRRRRGASLITAIGSRSLQEAWKGASRWPEGVGQAFQPLPDAAATFTMSLQAAGRAAGRYRMVFRSCHSRSSGQQGRRIDVT
jgi:hypothetical protein